MVASTLEIGDIAIVGYNTGQTEEVPNTTDRIHFVLLAPIGSGTTIYFSDRSWNGTTFAAAGGGEGTFAYTAGSDLPAGTVIEITQANLTAAGITLSESGETIYAYQGTGADAPTQFLFALEIADGNSTLNGSLVNTGLTAGYSAVSVGHDSGAYSGPTTYAESFLWNGAGSSLLHSIADATNWVGDDFAVGDNSKEQEVQTGSWLVHADTEFWGTMSGGGGGFANTLRDSTFASGNDDFNHTRIHDSGSSSNGAIVGQFWSLRDMVFDTVDGKFFVVDSDISGGHNRILQGNISDLIANPTSLPALTVLYSDTGTTTASRLDNLEVDVANNIIYFTHGDNLEKIVYDTAGQTPTVLFNANVTAATSPSGFANPAGSTNNFFNDMVIDFADGRIYLSSTRVLAGASGDLVSKNFIYELTGLTTGSGTDAFQFNGTNTGTARLLPFVSNDDAYNPNAGTTSSPATAANQAYFWAQEYGTIDGLAIDPVSNTLYFSTGEILFDHDLDSSASTGPVYAGGVVASYALTGNPTGIATILYQQTAQFGGAIPGLMGDLEIDTVNGHLYVLDYNGINGVNDDNHWFRMNTSASTPTQFTQTIGDIEGAATVGLTLNHAPTLSGSAGGGLAVTEASSAPNSGETARVTLFTGVTIADPDTSTADEITGAVVRVGDGFTFEASSTAGGHTGTVDYLRINGNTSGTIAGSGINYTYNQTTGAMVLTGAATVAEYKAAIELVQFSTSGDNVTNNGNSTTRTIHVSVSDGLTMSDEISATVNVTGINDAPVNTPGVAMNFTEDTTGNVGGNPNPPPAVVNAITGISIADADADATTETFTVTLTVNTGTLTIRTDVTGGLVAGDVVGNGTASLTLTGTQNEINATLAAVNGSAQANGLVYTAPANFNGAATLTIVTNDQGNNGNDPGSTGTGTSEEDSDTKTLNVADVNDAPTVGGDGTEDAATILEDTPQTDLTASSVATLFGGQFSDALDVQLDAVNNPTGSAGDTLAGIAVVANGSNANGQWQYWDGDSWENIGAASADAAKTFTAATLIRFSPTLDYNGAAPTLTVHLIETGGPAITNGGTVDLNPAPPTTGASAVYSATTVVLSQAITAVNDVPTSTNLSGDSVVWTEGDATVLLDSGGNATVADVDSANFDGGSLTVSISGGAVAAEDQLVITAAGTVTFDATTVSVGGTQIATYTGGGAGGGNLVFTLDADATPAAVQELLRAIGYTNTGGDDPTDGDRTITWTLVDGDGTANGGVDTLQFTSTVDVDPVDDAPVAQPDAVTTAENAVGTGDVFANNGSGADADVDGPALTVSAVNGSGANVGTQITLASGALLTLNADGTYSYDPNGAFNYLVSAATAAATGAVNDSATDTFTYTLAGGNTVTVTMTVTGVDGAGDQLWGDSGVNVINGTAGNDFFDVSQGGEDTVNGLGGSDRIYYGAAFTAADTNDGGADRDVVILQGNYTLTLGALSLVNVEFLSLQSGSITRWGDTAGNLYSYDITTVQENVLPGQQLAVNGQSLQPGENFTFDGSAETDGGRFLVYGGRGTDDLTGGTGNDIFSFEEPRWNATDTIDGGAGTDAVVLSFGDGLNTIVFGAGQFTSIESISVNNRFATDLSQTPSYALVLDNGNVALGATLIVNGQSLLAGQTISIDGSAVVDGRLRLFGGADADVLIGGANDDEMTGKGGADTFTYLSTADSKVALPDEILDFEVGIDTIDLDQIDAIAGGADDAFTFVGNAAFSSTAGELRAELVGGVWQVAGDTDGNGIADFLIMVTATTADPIGSTDFIL